MLYPDKHGINGLLIDPNEVRAILGVNYCEPTGLDRIGVKKMLHISQQTAYYLVKHDYLKRKITAHPRTGIKTLLVDEAEVMRFLKTHTTLGLMAYKIGTQAKHVVAKLEKLEIKPIKLPKDMSRIYLRVDVPVNYF